LTITTGNVQAPLRLLLVTKIFERQNVVLPYKTSHYRRRLFFGYAKCRG